MDPRWSAQRLSIQCWMDRKKGWKPGVYWVPMVTPNIAARRKKTDTSKSTTSKKNTDELTQGCRNHTILSSKQQFKKNKRLQLLIPLHLRISRKTICSRSKNRSSSKAPVLDLNQLGQAERDPVREEVWQSWWCDDSQWNTWSFWSQGEWRENIVAKSFPSLLNKEERSPKIAIFQWPTGCANNTPSTTVHFRRFAHSSTREHAFTNFLRCSKLSCKLKPSRFIFRKRSHSWSRRFASIACTDTLMHYTDPLHSGTTLDTQATVYDYKNPSAHSRFFGDFDERASLTEERSEVTLCAFAVWLRNARKQYCHKNSCTRAGRKRLPNVTASSCARPKQQRLLRRHRVVCVGSLGVSSVPGEAVTTRCELSLRCESEGKMIALSNPVS